MPINFNNTSFFKQNVEGLIIPLAHKILNIQASKWEEISRDLPHTLDRKPDFTKLVTDTHNQKFMLHLEFQVKNEAKMVLRRQMYKALIQTKYKITVPQFVIFLGNQKPKMKTHLVGLIPGEKSNYNFSLKNIKVYAHKQFIHSNIPEEILLAMLCDFKEESPLQVHGHIAHNLQKTSGEPIKLQKYLYQLTVLSRLRNLVNEPKQIIKKMPKEWKKDDCWGKKKTL